ncbi:carbonic anhydrase 1-like [Oppia nitens]|uniref:carbonic anhydrase 1-like n=1 Tax=Oppia nitens TaxID=1686743 RepID=UPI0023DA38EB|nr:carbonic anhydrase 1-like [Oppia nitens]
MNVLISSFLCADWSYNDQSSWSKDSSQCSGQNQSPININTKTVKDTKLCFHIHWGNQDNKGSEHSIDNKFSAAEIHFVHYNKKYGSLVNAMTKPDGLLVLSVLAKHSPSPNRNLNLLTKAAEKISSFHATHVIQSNSHFQLDQLFPINLNGIYRYQGSLTTPPCYETVTWLIFKNTIEISSDQIKVFRGLQQSSGKKLLTNLRNIQPLNGRTVFLF